VEKIVYAAVALTLIVGGCSLAVAVAGGLVDRRRPFTLLRVSGAQVGVPSEVALLEAVVPLVAATLVAAGIAYGTSLLAFVRLAPAGSAIPQLGHDYYALMGIGLVSACGIITVTLPLLRRMTSLGTSASSSVSWRKPAHTTAPCSQARPRSNHLALGALVLACRPGRDAFNGPRAELPALLAGRRPAGCAAGCRGPRWIARRMSPHRRPFGQSGQAAGR
jgi:hypothetical protein